GGQNGSGALPTNEGGGQALPVEEADPETRGEPTREESGTETVLQPTPGSQKTVTYTHSMLSVANVLLDVQGDIHVEPATGSEYEISFVLWTPAVGPAAEFMFDQYELVFEDDLADNVLHVEALSTLKPDSPFACQTVGGLSTCIGNPPATVSIVAKLPASFLNLTADANLGDVTIVDQAGAAVEAGTNTGDVRVSGSFANLDLETNTGSVHMDGAGGDLEAHSNSGNINVEGTFENVSMSTNQGDLTGTIAANVLSLDTNQGTATVDWTPVGASEFHHDGNSGNLDLTLPPGAYRLELETNLGDADVDARFQSKGEGVWETEGFESAAVKNYVYSDLNTGSQSVHS
ncbi:MAG: DUF4097 family beta strand repeat-containing protein, partial [Thermoplasmatota archaeon]